MSNIEKKTPIIHKHSVMTDTDSSDDSEDMKKSWIDSFLDQPFADWLCRIPLSFVSDGFNTYGIRVDPNHAKSAYSQLIGDPDESSDSFDSDSEDEIEECTERMYGLIHARYIYSSEGVSEMYRKYQSGVFGVCPRYYCKQAHLLPVGLYDRPGIANVKLYCTNCHQIYEPDELHSIIDGAFFGHSFPHFFLLELKANKTQDRAVDASMLTSESLSSRPKVP